MKKRDIKAAIEKVRFHVPGYGRHSDLSGQSEDWWKGFTMALDQVLAELAYVGNWELADVMPEAPTEGLAWPEGSLPTEATWGQPEAIEPKDDIV